MRTTKAETNSCAPLTTVGNGSSCTANLLITNMVELHAEYARIQNSFSPAVTAMTSIVRDLYKGVRVESVPSARRVTSCVENDRNVQSKMPSGRTSADFYYLERAFFLCNLIDRPSLRDGVGGGFGGP